MAYIWGSKVLFQFAMSKNFLNPPCEILLCSAGNYTESLMMEHDNGRKKNVYTYV